jgi:hypothetical protein
MTNKLLRTDDLPAAFSRSMAVKKPPYPPLHPHPHPTPPKRPSIMIYGGTIKPGHSAADGSVLDIVSAFQSYGGFNGVIWLRSQ